MDTPFGKYYRYQIYKLHVKDETQDVCIPVCHLPSDSS
jgi:hypothetical protein